MIRLFSFVTRCCNYLNALSNYLVNISEEHSRTESNRVELSRIKMNLKGEIWSCISPEELMLGITFETFFSNSEFLTGEIV